MFLWTSRNISRNKNEGERISVNDLPLWPKSHRSFLSGCQEDVKYISQSYNVTACRYFTFWPPCDPKQISKMLKSNLQGKWVVENLILFFLVTLLLSFSIFFSLKKKTSKTFLLRSIALSDNCFSLWFENKDIYS